MVSEKGRNSETQRINDEELLDERKSDATSDETLSDIEEADSASDSVSPEPGPGPSPDGAIDDRDEIKDAGPM